MTNKRQEGPNVKLQEGRLTHSKLSGPVKGLNARSVGRINGRKTVSRNQGGRNHRSGACGWPHVLRHFKTKDEQLLGVIDEFFEQLLADFDKYLTGFNDKFMRQ